MSGYFTRERFGRPQFLAGMMLVVFLGQAMWLVGGERGVGQGVRVGGLGGVKEGPAPGSGSVRNDKELGIGDGAGDLDGNFDLNEFYAERSPLIYMLAVGLPSDALSGESHAWKWVMRFPFLMCGVFLGASLWYVARRLC